LVEARADQQRHPAEPDEEPDQYFSINLI